MTPDEAKALRAPFPPETIGSLPKPYKADSQKGNCPECGGYHGLPAVHLAYVGHAAVTDRLLQVDPAWTWEPVAVDPSTGAPLMVSGGLWIRLTIAGVTRVGFGDGKNPKECIGDAIRNAAMRFGVALDLWAKESLVEGQHDRETPGITGPDPAKQAARGLRLQIASLAQTHGWDLTVLGQEFTQTYGVSTSSAGPDDLAAYLDELQGRALDQPGDPQTPGAAAAQGAAPGPEVPADAPPSPSPPEAGGAHPGKSAQDYADELTAATSKADVIPVLRALEIAGHGATEVADGNGEAVELRTYANARMKALS